MPSAADIVSIKAEKALRAAFETLEGAQLDKLTDMIERKLEDSDYSAVELAAAFLKMQMGEEPQEIQEVIPERRRNYRGSRDFGSGRQDRDNRSGKDGRGNNPRYGRNDGKRRSFSRRQRGRTPQIPRFGIRQTRRIRPYRQFLPP